MFYFQTTFFVMTHKDEQPKMAEKEKADWELIPKYQIGSKKS